jgi:uncharacterized protein
VGYKLHMSGEIRDWLADLRTSRPEAAAAVGKALAALLDTGPGLGRPIVVALNTRPASANPAEDLDYAYDSRLRQLRAIRWTLAEVNGRAMQMRAAGAEADASRAASATGDTAELRELLGGLDRAEERLTSAYQRMQSDADAFRARKDVLKARYTAAAIEDALAGIDAEMTTALARDDLAGHARSPAERAASLEGITAEIERELCKEPATDGLMELRPGTPGNSGEDVRIIFAVEPPGTVLLISVIEGQLAARDLRGEAAEISAQILWLVRVGQDPEAVAVGFAGARQFLDEFFAASGDEVRAGADELTAAARPGSPELTVPGLPFPLTAEGHPPCEHRIHDEALLLMAAPRTDMFVDPADPGDGHDAGRLVGLPPTGDFTLAARVSVDFTTTYDAGVLLLHADLRRWAKLCFELSPQHHPMAVTVVTRGTSDDCNSFEVAGRSLWLRITRTGPAWAFHASTDGNWWQLLRYFSLEASDEVKVGFLAQSPTGDGCTASFDHIAWRPGALADLRDGS